MYSNIIFAASSLALGSLWLEGCGGGANDTFLFDEGASEEDRRTVTTCDLEVVQLDFLRATEKENTLASGGRLVYGGLGSIGSRPFDLQVSALNAYQTNRAGSNGILGKVGQINVKNGERANLQFTFVDAESQEQVELQAFYFSIFDIDRPGGTSSEIIEVGGFEEIIFAANKEYNVEDTSDGGKLVTATSRGTYCDNALDPGKLEVVECHGRTIDQAARSFTMLFKKTSSFKITFEVPGESKDFGRNFQFAGWSSLVPACPTPSHIFLEKCASSEDQDHTRMTACNAGFANPADPDDTAKDPVDMIFTAASCVELGTDDTGNLWVSTVGCNGRQVITPQYVDPAGVKFISFPQSFRFQVKILGHTDVLQEEAEPVEFEVMAGKNYWIDLSATSNLISA